jgi:tRNA threonylcarbamoyl adenosine modification protein (Sua5/YciO/YrdC/YwlC family)
MAKEILSIHSKTPELRKIRKVSDALLDGKVILFPIDTGFALACNMSNKDGVERIRRIRKIHQKKRMTFLCQSLSNIAEFAKVSNKTYKTLKRLIPGPYTFILPATKQVPKYAVDSKRKTSGIRVPDNTLAQLLLKEVDNPIITISAKLDDDYEYQDEEGALRQFGHSVDLAVISDYYHFVGPSTIIDMTTDDFHLIREGAALENTLEYIDFADL